MSGIAAAVRFDGGPPPLDSLQRMIDAAPHRAPDGSTVWSGAGAALAKLHRLVLPGQRTSGQPAVERDGPHVAVFDGRLDAPAGDEDAEDALAAVARAGRGAAAALHGEFAFAVWNSRARTLVAGRDRLGMRPLYWTVHGPHLFVATDVAQLLAALPRVPQPDATAVGELLAFDPVRDARTLYAGIQRVPPGHVLVVDDRGAMLHEYWKPEASPADERRSDDEFAEECRALLRRSVSVRLRAAGPVVLFFSGGIDSSSVLATAIDLCREWGTAPPQPLSIVADQPESDERAYRQAFAAAYGVSAIEVQPAAIDAADYAAQARTRGLPPDLPADFIGRPLMWRARALGARVGLTGGGGDFLFTGSTLYYADLIRRGRPGAAIARYLRDRTTEDSGWAPSALFTAGVWPLLPRGLRTAIRRPVRRAMRIEDRPEWVRLPRPDRDAVPGPPPGVSHASWDVCWSLRNGWTSALLESNERAMAESGIEPRHPLFDASLVRFALSLPERQRRRGSTIKYVLRRAANLPAPIQTRRTKADFGYVILDALEALGGRAFFEQLQIAEEGWVDAIAASRGYDLVRARPDWRDPKSGGLLPRLWILAAVELWYRAMFGVREGAN